MQSFMIMLLTCSVTMSALALLYMAVSPFLAKHYSEKGRYYAWLVIVIGLIIPIRPQFDNAIVKVDVPNEITTSITQTENETTIFIPEVNAELPSSLPSIIRWKWWQIAAVVWLIGMIVFLTYHIIKHFYFIKMVRRWSSIITDEHVLTLFQDLKIEMGISKRVDLYMCPCISSPMMIGFINPRILLPKCDFAQDELSFILKHELIHYNRNDLWYKLLVFIATAVHWFNPIVHLTAKAIAAECELSCDAEVVRNTGTDTRYIYSETIIGVIKYQSKLKTILSTNFYGGKKGMKKRISSILDTNKKKTGIAIICSVLIATMGTGFAFAAKAETQGSPEIIKEDIVTSPWISVGFLPDPDIYAKYSAFGISISDDGTKLLYEKQPVRLFADDNSDAEAFYFDEAGTVNLSVIRNSAGEIKGIESISAQKAQEYKAAFFADEPGTVHAVQDSNPTEPNKYSQYQTFGIKYSETDKILYFNGQRVKLFVDQYPDGWFGTFWTDEAGILNLAVVRNASGQITSIENISDEKAQEYRASASENEQSVLDGLDEKIAKKIASSSDYLDSLYEKAYDENKQKNAEMEAMIIESNAKAFSVYEQYGLSYSKETNRLYYDGKLVRYFEDNKNTDGTFNGTTFPNADGDVDVYALHNSSGKLTGLKLYNQADFNARTKQIQNDNHNNNEASVT